MISWVRIRSVAQVFHLITSIILLIPIVFPQGSNKLILQNSDPYDPATGPVSDLFSTLDFQFTLTPGAETIAQEYPWTLAGGGMLIGPGKILYNFLESAQNLDEKIQSPSMNQSFSLEVEWLGATENIRLVGAGGVAGTINYLLGDDPDNWYTGQYGYKAVTIQDLYPGIDLEFNGQGGHLKSQYTVSAFSNPLQIHWRYSNGISPQIDLETGDLQVYSSGQLILTEKAPLAWQIKGQHKIPVNVKYLVNENEVSFVIEEYDPRLQLLIDPLVEFSTYIGGGTFATGDRVVVDGDGYIYIAGRSLDQKYFVAKLDDNNKSFVYTSFVGTNVSGSITGLGLDPSGNAYISGVTFTDTHPLQNPLQNYCPDADGFLTKLNPSGTALLFSTYLCGNRYDEILAMQVGTDGKVYLAGATSSTDFPVTVGSLDTVLGGTRDGFVAILDTTIPDLTYATYLGGGQEERLQDIYLDSSGILYLTGFSNSTDYPVVSPISSYHGGNCWYGACNDAVISKFNSVSKALVYSTYLGGSGSDVGSRITTDASGNILIAGVTDSTDVPLVNPFQDINYQGGGPSWGGELFLMKLNSTGANILYSTYLGGTGEDQVADIVVIDNSNAFAVMGTSNTCLPPFTYKNAGHTFSYIVEFDQAGLPAYFYLPGGYSYTFPGELAVDASSSIYAIGQTSAPDFPLLNPFSTTISNAFLVKIAQKAKPAPSFPNKVFLPLVIRSIQKTPLGIFGRVTENGCGASGVPLELRYYNGSSWATRAATTTAEDGKYSFTGLPSLTPGEYYYVRFTNPDDPGNVFFWTTPSLVAYEAGQDVFLSNFDISGTSNRSPESESYVPLPVLFQWGRRPYPPTDSYDFNLGEYFGSDEWYTPPLGYVGSYTLPSLPLNFNFNEWEYWYIGIHIPDGGYGEVYDVSYVKFAPSGLVVTGPVSGPGQLDLLDQTQAARLEEAETKRLSP